MYYIKSIQKHLPNLVKDMRMICQQIYLTGFLKCFLRVNQKMNTNTFKL